jgi:ubiquinone/menaquinone biosynthesis C-methylase UbiE
MENCPAPKDERHHHHHRGKFSEGLIDQERVINALNIKPGQIILDAGCGNGYMSKAFAKQISSSGKVYALDEDTHFINILKTETQGTTIEATECDITQPLPIEQASVDLVYISAVIHGFSSQQLQDFLREAKRILKPGGMLAIVEIEKKETSFGPPINIRFSPEELKEIVPMVPLNTVQVGKHFYMQMFKNNNRAY